MEVEKVLGVFEEIIEEEETYKVQTILTNILSYASSENSEQVESYLKELKTYAENSIINSYAFSKIKILNKVGGEKLFGNDLYEYVEEILSTKGYKIKDTLSKDISRRNTLITMIKTNTTNLDKLDFESYYNELEEYELGLIIPEDEANLKKVENYLKDLNFMLKTIYELSDGNHGEPKVHSVSTSSIGVFILCSYIIAKCILDLTDRVLKIYERVQKIKKLKLELKEFDLKEGQKEIDSKIKDIVSKEKDKIITEIMKEYGKNIPAGRKNELEKAVKRTIEIIIKMQDKKVILEATAPKVSDEEDQTEDETSGQKSKNEKSKLEKAKEVSEIFSNVAKSIKDITLTGKEVLQLAHYNEVEKEEEK